MVETGEVVVPSSVGLNAVNEAIGLGGGSGECKRIQRL